MAPHFGFGLEGVHIEGNLLYLKCNGTREDVGEGGEVSRGRRRMRGGDALGRDATFSWSRGLTHSPRC